MILEFMNRFASHGVTGSSMELRDCSSAELRKLRQALDHFAGAAGARLAVHELPFVARIANAELHAVSAKRDGGALFRRGPGAVSLVLSPSGWGSALQALDLLADEKVDGGSIQLNATDYGPRVVCIAASR